jgi:hypothetical protein
MIKKVSIVIILLILFISCKENVTENSIETIEITNEFRLQFLNEILSDTVNIKLLNSKNDLISNRNSLPPPSFENSSVNKESHYISELLEIRDTLFVQKQFELNPTFSFDDLSKFGFNVFDVNSMHKSGKGYYSVLNEVNLYYKGCKECKSDCLLVLSKPIFNKNRNKAYLRYGCGSDGRTLIFSKENNVWEIEKEIDIWVE